MIIVSVNRQRPDFRVFIDLLYGAGRNVDTDGDANPVDSRIRTYLYIADSDSTNASLEIYADETSPHLFTVKSDFKRLEERAALYMFLSCGVAILIGGEVLNENAVSELKPRYETESLRADESAWNQPRN